MVTRAFTALYNPLDVQWRQTACVRPGNITLENVRWSDSKAVMLPAGVTFTIGRLLPGELRWFVADIRFTLGCNVNTASVNGTANGVVVRDTDSAHYCAKRGPDIEIDKQVHDGRQWHVSWRYGVAIEQCNLGDGADIMMRTSELLSCAGREAHWHPRQS